MRQRAPWVTHRQPAPGTAPGSLEVDANAPKSVVHVMAYGPSGFVEHQVETLDEIDGYRNGWPVVWINVDGLGDESTLRWLAERFGFHRLALEDIVNVGQRAKAEQYEEDLFLVGRIPRSELGATEQISFFVGDEFLVTFQEESGDCFDGVRERIRQGRGKLRKAKVDYLLYTLLDSVVDSYFPVLETVSDRFEELEEEVFSRPTPETMREIHGVKQSLVALRKAAGPHRELVNSLLRESSGRMAEGTLVYLRDCYDHALRVQEGLDTFREMASDLMNNYLSSISHRMNEVMKVLTIIATIFIPLGFVAGLYGMNFNPEISRWNMPELNWTLGYPFALLLMAGMAAGLIAFFWRKGWFR